eukprot:ANDGO_03592.mRNA.1 hypothetical protein
MARDKDKKSGSGVESGPLSGGIALRGVFSGSLTTDDQHLLHWTIDQSSPGVFSMQVFNETIGTTYSNSFDVADERTSSFASPIEGCFAQDELVASLIKVLQSQSLELEMTVKYIEPCNIDQIRSHAELWHDTPILGDALLFLISANPDARARSHPDYKMTLVLFDADTKAALDIAALNGLSATAGGAKKDKEKEKDKDKDRRDKDAVMFVPRLDIVRNLRMFRAEDDKVRRVTDELLKEESDLKAIVKRQEIQLMKLTALVDALSSKVSDQTVLSVSFSPKGLQRVPCGKFSKSVWTWRHKIDPDETAPDDEEDDDDDDDDDDERNGATVNDKQGATGRGTEEVDSAQNLSDDDHDDDQQTDQDEEDTAGDQVDAADLKGEQSKVNSLRPFVDIGDNGCKIIVEKSGRYLVNASLRFVDVSENVFLCVDGKRRFKHGGGEYAWSNFHLTIHFNQVVDLHEGSTISFETDATVDKWQPEDWLYSNSLFLTRLGSC